MLESSSFNKLLSGVRECNRMLSAAARNGNRQCGPTLKVGAQVAVVGSCDLTGAGAGYYRSIHSS
jgi:hypothetical protein